MCDFRKVQQIQFIGTSGILDITELKHCRVHTFDIPGVPYITQVKEPGFYHIVASGSCHSYYDGQNWLLEDRDYIVTKFIEHDWYHHHA